MAVVDLDLSLSLFVWHEHVLVKFSLQSGDALAAAAPSLDLRGLFDLDILLHLDGLLTDAEHLLMLEIHRIILTIDLGLDEVLDLGLG